ncbi:MAG: NlpC/P60 family protein [Actinomycetia bacterium]|nr:NlpC/P60 family protein [Actinomycetes bacterium]
MEPAHTRTRIGTVIGALCAITLALPSALGHATPGPSAKDLKDQATKLHDRLEQITEQYNGLKVRLDQSQWAAKVAADNARRQQTALAAVQQRMGRLAATSYMNGGVDPSVELATSRNPQSLLDQASTLNFFAARDGAKYADLFQAIQASVRAGKAALERTGEVQTLTAELDQRRKQINDLYGRTRDKIAAKDPSLLRDLPFAGGSGKAAEAVNWALKQLGKPYVWGAAGPETFDCSGLTMWAYGKVGVSLAHYTGSQWNAGTHVRLNQLQPGDLIFFYSDLHHMGMYVGNGQMVHAPHTGDVVRISPLAGRPIAGAVRLA